MAALAHSLSPRSLIFSSRFLRLSKSQNRINAGGLTSIAINARPRLFSTAEVSDGEVDVIHDDGGAVEKENALRVALAQLSSEFGKESMLSLQRFFGSRSMPVISTGSLKLDLALGIGGLPKGRMVEIYGREASGKTTLALHVIKEAQKLGGYCAYLDVENAMDPSLAESIGVNMDNLLLSPPDAAENLLSTIDTLTKSGSVDVIVVDSVAALVPQQELDNLVGEGEHMQSRILNQALRKIHYSLCRSETLIIFLNQTRSGLKSGQVLGHAEEVTCGGNALKFYSAVRLRMMRTKYLKSEDKVTGLGLCVQVVKNKLAPAMKKAELEIQFGRGFSYESEILELASESGIIWREGANYRIEGEVFRNKHKAEKYLAKNELVRDEIVAAIRELLLNFRSS